MCLPWRNTEGSKSVPEIFANLGTRWREFLSVTPGLFYSLRKNNLHLFNPLNTELNPICQ